jgi:enterochelin esterase family protein
MKRRHRGSFLPVLLLLIPVYLLSCAPTTSSSPSTPPPVLMDGCDQTGQVLDGEVEETARGYPYVFKIYLPPCYADQPDARYPVFYFVPGRGGGPEAWFRAGINSIADKLILDRAMPPFIIVTTGNTENDPQAMDIHGDLVPYIDREYRTLAERSYRAAAGGSLGGIAAYRLGFAHPETFSSVGMFGSGAISGEEKQIRAWLDDIPSSLELHVFMDTGEADPLMLDRARIMDSLLNEYAVPHVLNEGDGGHDYLYWASNLEMYFLWAAETWQ